MPVQRPREKPSAKLRPWVLPRDFRIQTQNARLIDIYKEMIRIKWVDFSNAGAILMRAFFELAVLDYLDRTGELSKLTEELKKKNALQYEVPSMKQLIPAMIRIAKNKLPANQAAEVEKAIKYNPSAPFTVSDLHTFVHQPAALPTERDIMQFWLRTEPLFRLMLVDE